MEKREIVIDIDYYPWTFVSVKLEIRSMVHLTEVPYHLHNDSPVVSLPGKYEHKGLLFHFYRLPKVPPIG